MTTFSAMEDGKKSKFLNAVKVSEDLFDQVQQSATAHGRKITDQIRYLIELGLGRSGQDIVLQRLSRIEDLIHESAHPENYAHVPLYEANAAAGGGAVVESEQVIQDVAFRRDWIKTKLRANVKDLGCLTITGQSMEPTICSGDLAMFDRAQRTLKHDQIYVLRDGGELMVKRLCLKHDGMVEIHSDNPDPRFKRALVKRDTLDVVGRVVWVAGKRG